MGVHLLWSHAVLPPHFQKPILVVKFWFWARAPIWVLTMLISRQHQISIAIIYFCIYHSNCYYKVHIKITPDFSLNYNLNLSYCVWKEAIHRHTHLLLQQKTIEIQSIEIDIHCANFLLVRFVSLFCLREKKASNKICKRLVSGLVQPLL